MIGELIVHGILFALMLLLYITAGSFEALNTTQEGSLGPGWWPRATMLLGMLMTIASAVMAIQKNGRNKAAGGKAKGKVKKEEIKSLAISAVIFVIFILALDYVGFIFAAPILIAGFMLQLGARKPLGLVLIPTISGVMFALVFGRFMEVNLPRGIDFIRLLSFYIY
jgi:hypothetical protein